MKTLEIYEEHVHAAFEIIGDCKALFDNDGREPGGFSWFPKTPIPEEIAQAVVDAGHGRFVEVWHWTDDQLIDYLRKYFEDTSHEPVQQRNLEYLNKGEYSEEDFTSELCLHYLHAHYGELGTPSSLWILSTPVQKYEAPWIVKNESGNPSPGIERTRYYVLHRVWFREVVSVFP